MLSFKDRICLALDVDSTEKAMSLVDATKDSVGMYKVGMQLYTKEGPDIIRRLKERDLKVFLDLKFHDIPTTVANAAIEATRLGVDIFNIHALGGSGMMKKTIEDVREESVRLGIQRPKVIAVTLLTSINQDTLGQDLLVNVPIRSYIRYLALGAYLCDLDGIVCSPLELKMIQEAIHEDFIYITPGIRPAGSAINDQQRITTPQEAINNGATYIVIGRPITHAQDPESAAANILHELRNQQ